VGAGGLWMPFHCDDKRTDRWSLETLQELWTIGQNPQTDKNLVEIMTAIVLQQNNDGVRETTKDTISHYPDTNKLPMWTRDARLDFQQLTVEMLSWQNIVYKLRIPPEDELKRAGYYHAWMFQTPIVDSPNMLEVRTVLYCTDVCDFGNSDGLQNMLPLKKMKRLAAALTWIFFFSFFLSVLLRHFWRKSTNNPKAILM